MAHNIYNNSVASYRQPMWHGLGTVWESRVSPTEALSAIGADITYIKAPNCAIVESDFGQILVPSPDSFSIVRPPIRENGEEDYVVVGTCGSNYEIIQNRDIAELIESLSDSWGVETAGLLGETGNRFFMTIDLNATWNVKNEQINDFYLVDLPTTGTDAISLSLTPIRVVCQNTLTMALNFATASVKIPHSRQAMLEIEFRTNLLRNLYSIQDKAHEVLSKMASVALSEGDVSEILERIYPFPSKPRRLQLAESVDVAELIAASDGFMSIVRQSKMQYEAAISRTETNRSTVLRNYRRFCDEYPATAKTAWALYNTVVECEDFLHESRGENRNQAAVFGKRAQTKARAFSVITEYI